jgi:predicted membrane protein
MNTFLTILAVVIVLFILYRIFKLLFSVIISVVFVIAAYITNPSVDEHQEAVQKKAESTSVSVNNKNITVKDYWIFSLTELGREKKVVGAGAFSHVFIFGDLETNQSI